MNDLPLIPSVIPCEKCGEDIIGYQAVYRCGGTSRECTHKGVPLEPCLCFECWDEIDKQKSNDKTELEKKQMDIKQIAVQVENNTKTTLAILEVLDRQAALLQGANAEMLQLKGCIGKLEKTHGVKP